jgi:hypothetical protein
MQRYRKCCWTSMSVIHHDIVASFDVRESEANLCQDLDQVDNTTFPREFRLRMVAHTAGCRPELGMSSLGAGDCVNRSFLCHSAPSFHEEKSCSLANYAVSFSRCL